MSKKSKIRWSKEDRKQITNAVRVFNSKLTRVLKSHPELQEFLPRRRTTQELYDKIETRQDFKREINSLLRFLRKGAEAPLQSEKGIKTTKWEEKEIGIKVRTINAKRTRERKQANVSTYKGTMGSIEANNLKPKFYDINKIEPKDWEKFVRGVEKQIASTYGEDKYDLYKSNYLKALDNVFGSIGERIKKIVEKIPNEVFYKLYYDDPVLQIDFVYDPDDAEFLAENIVEHLNSSGFD